MAEAVFWIAQLWLLQSAQSAPWMTFSGLFLTRPQKNGGTFHTWQTWWMLEKRWFFIISSLGYSKMFKCLQTKVSTLVQGFPHLGQQKWLSLPPFEELPDRLAFPVVVVSAGGFVPVLQSTTLVEMNRKCGSLTVMVPLDNPIVWKKNF